MNTAISLDMSIFREAEREAEHLCISVPEFCSLAMKEFIKNNNKSSITKQLDVFYSTHKAKIDEDIMQAQYDILSVEAW